MKTKEECLLRNGVFKNDLNGYSTNVMKAMDEYASQFQQEWIPVEDIRNKLSPITNLITMIENGLMKGNIEVHDLVLEEIKQCKKSITYLSKPQPYNPTKP